MTCTENSENRLPKLKNVIKDQLIHAKPRHRTSVSVNKCSSKQHISGRQDLQRNYRKRTLDPSKLSLKLDQHPSPYDSPEHMKAVHPVFHVSHLELSTPNTIPN